MRADIGNRGRHISLRIPTDRNLLRWWKLIFFNISGHQVHFVPELKGIERKGGRRASIKMYHH